MRDVDKALDQILEIRSQIAAGSTFRGFGPATLAATGALALATAGAQSLWLPAGEHRPLVFLASWVAAAVVSVGLVAAETLRRSRRHHQGLSDAMIRNAIEQFLPAGVAGAALLAVLARFAPQDLWMLPGLWQVLFSLGLFAAARTLPRAMILAAAWYLVAGMGVLMASSLHHSLSPWAMGVPFLVGQLAMAGVLQVSPGDSHAA